MVTLSHDKHFTGSSEKLLATLLVSRGSSYKLGLVSTAASWIFVLRYTLAKGAASNDYRVLDWLLDAHLLQDR